MCATPPGLTYHSLEVALRLEPGVHRPFNLYPAGFFSHSLPCIGQYSFCPRRDHRCACALPLACAYAPHVHGGCVVRRLPVPRLRFYTFLFYFCLLRGSLRALTPARAQGWQYTFVSIMGATNGLCSLFRHKDSEGLLEPYGSRVEAICGL